MYGLYGLPRGAPKALPRIEQNNRRSWGSCLALPNGGWIRERRRSESRAAWGCLRMQLSVDTLCAIWPNCAGFVGRTARRLPAGIRPLSGRMTCFAANPAPGRWNSAWITTAQGPLRNFVGRAQRSGGWAQYEHIASRIWPTNLYLQEWT